MWKLTSSCPEMDFRRAQHVQHAGVVGTQYRTQLARRGHGLVNAFLVGVVTQHIDAVGAGQVVEPVAVQVLDLHAFAVLQEGTDLDVLAQHRAELEGHTVAAGEAQVGDGLARFFGGRQRLGEAGVELGAEALQRGLAAVRRYRPVRHRHGEELRLVIGIARHPACQPLGHARVPGQRAMLGARQLQAPLGRRQQREHAQGQAPTG